MMGTDNMSSAPFQGTHALMLSSKLDVIAIISCLHIAFCGPKHIFVIFTIA